MAVATAHPDTQVPLDTIPISPSDVVSADGTTVTSNTLDSNEQITVFHDPDNFNVKHPLSNKWTLWFTKPPSGKVSYLTVLLKAIAHPF